MELYHVTTPKKAKRYRESGFIKSPVRGFTTIITHLVRRGGLMGMCLLKILAACFLLIRMLRCWREWNEANL